MSPKLPRWRWRRDGLLAIAVGWVVLAVSFAQLPNEFPVTEWFWPVWFAVAGVTVAVFAFRPTSFWLCQTAGVMSMTALASRVGAVLLKVWAGSYPTAWSGPIGVIIYGFAAFWFWRWWISEVMAWHRRHRDALTIPGD